MKLTIEITDNDFANTPKIIETLSALMGFVAPAKDADGMAQGNPQASDTPPPPTTPSPQGTNGASARAKTESVAPTAPPGLTSPSKPELGGDLPLFVGDVYTPPPKGSVTIELIRAKANELIDKSEINRPKIKALLDKFGVPNMSALEKNSYETFHSELEAI